MSRRATSHAARRRTTRSSSRSSTTTRATRTTSRKQVEARPRRSSTARWRSSRSSARRARASSPASTTVAEFAGGEPLPRRPRLRAAARARPRLRAHRARRSARLLQLPQGRAPAVRLLRARSQALPRGSRRSTRDPKLVLLGDYIDRGLFSFNGVLRTVLQLFVDRARARRTCCAATTSTTSSRRARSTAACSPPRRSTRSSRTLPHRGVRGTTCTLFERMPNMLLFDRTLFVHAGIPRDDALAKERWKDLSSPQRPRHALPDDVERSERRPTSSPPSCRSRTRASRSGGCSSARSCSASAAHTMVRGHEKVDEGFQHGLRRRPTRAAQRCSPRAAATTTTCRRQSSYREVTPMALTMTGQGRPRAQVTPWAIDYERYNDPERNAFFRVRPRSSSARADTAERPRRRPRGRPRPRPR